MTDPIFNLMTAALDRLDQAMKTDSFPDPSAAGHATWLHGGKRYTVTRFPTRPVLWYILRESDKADSSSGFRTIEALKAALIAEKIGWEYDI